MKKRKFFSLFAILFVAVFALSCCFFFACNKDDSTEPEDTGTTQDPGTTENPGTTEDPGTTPDPGTTEDPGTTNPGSTEIDSRIVLKEGSVEGNNDNTVTFANPAAKTLYIADTTADDDGNVTYTLAGTASVMDENQANDFWAGHAAAGDAYVIITVSFEEEETVSWTASNGETRERTVEDYEDGEMDVIIRISGDDLSTEIAGGTATYTITDSEGGEKAHTVDFSAVIPEKEAETSSFIVPMATGGAADTTQYEANSAVVTNDIFELTTIGGMSYSMGKDNTALQGSSGNEASFTDMSGTTHKPNQGLISEEKVTPTLEGTGESAVITPDVNDDIIEVTAKESATIYLYISISNLSFNKNMNGSAHLDYSVNGGTVTQVAAAKRGEVMTLTLTLTAGDVVKIGITNSTTDSNVTEGTGAAIWLFGAEAVAEI